CLDGETICRRGGSGRTEGPRRSRAGERGRDRLSARTPGVEPTVEEPHVFDAGIEERERKASRGEDALGIDHDRRVLRDAQALDERCQRSIADESPMSTLVFELV